jgi:hypothetical protein
MKRLGLLFIVVFITACAPWAKVGGDYRADSQNYSVSLPDGWMRSNMVKELLITRDGVLLQNIRIDSFKLDQELKHTKKKYSKNMLPQEMAEVTVDDIKSDPMVMNFKLLENSPATISGSPGFKIVYEFRTKEGELRFKSIHYGTISGEWYYGIRYLAASRYYFDKDVGTFESVVQSFRLIRT